MGGGGEGDSRGGGGCKGVQGKGHMHLPYDSHNIVLTGVDSGGSISVHNSDMSVDYTANCYNITDLESVTLSVIDSAMFNL